MIYQTKINGQPVDIEYHALDGYVDYESTIFMADTPEGYFDKTQEIVAGMTQRQLNELEDDLNADYQENITEAVIAHFESRQGR